MEYDDLGRPRKTYNPFYGSTPVAAVPGGTAYSAVTGMDLIGRTTEVTLQDGTKVHTAYGYGSDFTYVTVTDQAGKQRRQVADALGRVVRVDEPYTNGSLGTVTSPAQPTYYEYDGNKLGSADICGFAAFTLPPALAGGMKSKKNIGFSRISDK